MTTAHNDGWRSNPLQKFVDDVHQWAMARDLIHRDRRFAQLTKTVEELGELAAGVARSDNTKIKDGIGDVVVTLVILAHQHGLDFAECCNYAWNEIAHRKGKTVDGVFVKEGDHAVD